MLAGGPLGVVDVGGPVILVADDVHTGGDGGGG